jgi:starch synthase
VLSRYGLKVSDETMRRPLVGMISRLVDQKGFDLLGLLGDALADFDATWIVLGTGDPRYQQWWTDLAGRHSTRVGVRIGFDEALAHLIEGGADLFLMPSRFEPCGLNQMYSLRYGTVPVVHGVGGLLDTVHDDPSDPSASTGFVFREYTASALVAALTRAFAAFADRPRWQALQRAGMRQDNSWDRSAREYVTMYERALRVRGQRAVGAR